MKIIKEDNKLLNEIIVLRAIACISIVSLHSIKFVIPPIYDDLNLFEFSFLTLAGFLSFGTAAFVIISEIILSYSYRSKPINFWKKRIQFILIPFLSMGVLYGIVYNIQKPNEIIINIILNFFGNYHGWFVLVIFQFYIVHFIFNKYYSYFDTKKAIITSLLINVAYLAYFNFTTPPSHYKSIVYFWNEGYFKLFFAWIFYFTIAFYIGKSYSNSLIIIAKNKKKVFLLLVLSTLLVIINNLLYNLDFGSKRFDMIFFTFFLVLSLLFFAREIKPNLFIYTISRYSFGIYLIHYFYLFAIKVMLDFSGLNFGYIDILVYFIGSIILSIISIIFINRFNFGKYIVGKNR